LETVDLVTNEGRCPMTDGTPITEIPAAEELRISEERHRVLAEHANDVIGTMPVAGGSRM
jgi:hypothetical protein